MPLSPSKTLVVILVSEFGLLDLYMPILERSLFASYDLGTQYPISSLEAFRKGMASTPCIDAQCSSDDVDLTVIQCPLFPQHPWNVAEEKLATPPGPT